MSDTRPTSVSDRDVYLTRSFAAPRELLWKFWLSPEHLTKWFGPTDIRTPLETITVEPRVGGRWHLTMVDESGQQYPIRGTITVLREFEYFEIAADADTGIGQLEDIVLRVTFHDHGERTRVTLHQGPFTDEQRDMTSEGWELSFLKLDTVLEQEQS